MPQQPTEYISGEKNYKENSENFHKMTETSGRYLLYRDLPSLFPRGDQHKKALDFGSGTGQSAWFLKNFGYEVIGVDIDAHMISQAKQNYPGIEFK
jgi:SAM-dependent methyltransferase